MNKRITFSEEEYRLLSRKAALSPNAARRILGSITVNFSAKQSNSNSILAEPKSYNIGLRLEKNELFHGIDKEILIDVCHRAIKDYAKCCPQVYNWISSGKFNLKEVPSQITLAILKHASITCGRLRAKVLREV